MPTLAFEIDYAHERAGWINCWLIIDGERHTLAASYAFPPFQPLLRFVKAVAGQRLPVKFYWDEEGIGADFEATAIADDSPLIHLKIKHDDSAAPWFDDVIERETVIQAFLPPIADFSKKFLKAEVEWFTPRRLVEKFQKAIVAGIPLRLDIHSPQAIECLVKGSYDIGYIEGRVYFHVIFEEEYVSSILLFDTNLFWKQAPVFFGNIASGNLPTACEHLRVFEWNATPESPASFRLVTRLVAEPLDVAENFRLKIFTQYQDEPEFLRLDEVANRHQFVSGFADSFKQFLRKEYQVTPDTNGNTFDLRTLSLEKFDQESK